MSPPPAKRPGTPQTITRNALAPGFIAAIVLLAGLALIGNDWFLAVRYVASIFALIICVFAVQAARPWWLIGLVPIAILWNPIYPITIDGVAWRLLQLGAAVVFIAGGIGITAPVDEKRR